MTETTAKKTSIFYPPGGLLIWIVIYLELFTFGAALLAMVVYAKDEPEVFHNSRLLLNTTFGAINTVFLLCSGFFMALSISALKQNHIKKAKRFLIFTLIGGLLFLGLKSVEYYDKIQDGLTMGYNTFFSFYWMLTLFHVIHVLVGLVILLWFLIKLNKNPEKLEFIDAEAGAAFWHMCDLIWLMLFPVLYLIF
ncbi:MAG: cytochrome c oxidase subunit 3 [Flavobacteriaceae bacterium]